MFNPQKYKVTEKIYRDGRKKIFVKGVKIADSSDPGSRIQVVSKEDLEKLFPLDKRPLPEDIPITVSFL